MKAILSGIALLATSVLAGASASAQSAPLCLDGGLANLTGLSEQQVGSPLACLAPASPGVDADSLVPGPAPSANAVTVVQFGADNVATLSQAGTANQIGVVQAGDGNASTTAQIGYGLSLDVTQWGGRSVAVTQTGTGSGIPVTVTQY